ncbi:MAG: biotin-dependent carboxyltransferase family protein [Pedobacter sp.]|nr:MAG: biotin-dependent carboxyltransferase family protein [Pedobacter sp.]
MGIKVLKPGLLNTIQDLGRYGYQKDGMIVCGAMDIMALRIGNILLGNAEGEAGIELTVIGGAFIFEDDQLIAITGAELNATVDGIFVSNWKPIFVKKGQVLAFGKNELGCRAYLIVAGGFVLTEVLSSYSTYLRAAIGGWEGRALKSGDMIPFKKQYTHGLKKFNWLADLKTYPDLTQRRIRFVSGPHADLFTVALSGEYKITNNSDRMGFRLDGLALLQKQPVAEMLSTAVTFGTIQVPPDGQPIVLMADHQTTGGYPIIGQVISVDLPLLAQKKPGDAITFAMVSVFHAQQLIIDREKYLNQFKQTMQLKYE